MEIVNSAGCVVLRDGNREPEVLLVFTKDYPDPTIPKGKVEPGESHPECALREVREETGYRVEIIADTPVVTERILDAYPPAIRKITHWFLAEARAGGPEERTEKELISRVSWMPVSLARREIIREDELGAIEWGLELAAQRR